VKELFDGWVLAELDETLDLEVSPSFRLIGGEKFLMPIE
jgi:hypothetical protein